jgi:hypothetical protein
MRVVVTFKLGSEAGFTKSQECEMQQKDHDRLKADWEKYCKDAKTSQGGVYAYHHRGEERALLLRFDDVLFVE